MPAVGMATRRLQQLVGQFTGAGASSSGNARRPRPPRPKKWQAASAAASADSSAGFELTAELKYEFDVKGYFLLKGHFDAAAVARFHAGIDEHSQHVGVTSRGG